MKRLSGNIKQWIKAFLMALLTVVLIKSFVFWVYFVPSTSMEKTLMPGDLIVVSKWEYGLRLPITPLTFPLSHQKLPFLERADSYLSAIQLPYLRLFSKEIKRNDVVVFNYPMDTEHPVDHRSFFIKRCVGLPGDTLIIEKRKVLANGKAIAIPGDLCFDYHVVSSIELTPDTLSALGITQGGRISGKNSWQLTLSDSNKKHLESQGFIEDIQPMKISKGNFADYIFPYHKDFKWNIDYFGPLVIPKEGNTITLSKHNLRLYARIIVLYENHKLEAHGGEILLDGEPASQYTFEMDYYFMMGDNRHNSSDSRFWGFVPEDHIVGKASTVLFSMNKSPEADSKFRWERFFLPIR